MRAVKLGTLISRKERRKATKRDTEKERKGERRKKGTKKGINIKWRSRCKFLHLCVTVSKARIGYSIQFTNHNRASVVHDDGVRLCRWTATSNGSVIYPYRCYMSMESHGGIILTGESQITRRKTCHNATLSTINPTWTDPGPNLGLRCEKPSTKHGPVQYVSELKYEYIVSSTHVVN
jgi:hypothetical protein